MAWTTPRTWTTGETVNKTIMDSHVRDNLGFLYTNEFGSYTASSTTRLTTGVFTLVAWDAETEESSNLTHDNVTNNSRVTAVLAGLYEVNIGLGWGVSAVGMRGTMLRKNSAGNSASGTQLKLNYQPATPSQACSATLNWTVRLTASDYIEVFRYSSATAATTGLDPTAIDSQPGVMTVRRVSA